MLIPITALRAGARRLGAGDFGHRIEVQHQRTSWKNCPTSSTAWPASCRRPMRASRAKVEERTRDLAHSINELKVLEEVGRAVASSLDLNAVLPTVAARALEITHADAVLIYGYDAGNAPVQPHRGHRHRQGGRAAAISPSTRPSSVLGEAASQRRADRDSRSRRRRRSSAARRRDRRRLPFGAGGAAGRPDRACWARWWCCAERRRILRQSDRADEDLCAPVGAGDAQCAAVSPRSTRRAANSRPRTPPCSSRPPSCRSRPTSCKNWNRSLEERVEKQLGEIERIRRLERFLRAAGGAADRLLRRPRCAARQPPPRGHRGVLRSARLHRLHREPPSRKRR